jgi:hypothetical protein
MVVIAERDCMLIAATPHASQPIILNKRKVVRLRWAVADQAALLSYQLRYLLLRSFLAQVFCFKVFGYLAANLVKLFELTNSFERSVQSFIDLDQQILIIYVVHFLDLHYCRVDLAQL